MVRIPGKALASGEPEAHGPLGLAAQSKWLIPGYCLLALALLFGSAAGVLADNLVIIASVGERTPVCAVIKGTSLGKQSVRIGTITVPLSKNVRDIPVPAQAGLQRYQAEREAVLRGGMPTAEALAELAEKALEFRLLDQSAEIMTMLAKEYPHDPRSRAFQQVTKHQLAPLAEDDEHTVAMRTKLLSIFREKRSDHYTLYHYPAIAADSAENCLKQLEATYRAFFYWFALKSGNTTMPPRPNHRLVAVMMPGRLTARKDDFDYFKEMFALEPPIAGGFLARRQNVLFVADRPLDPNYETLKASTGKLSPSPQGDKLAKNELVKTLENEAIVASVSHHGTRQLLAATGLVPAAVATPRWAFSGMGSFLETPLGAPWGNVGGTRVSFYEEHNYLDQFRQLASQDGFDAAKVMRDLLTDHAFHEAESKRDPTAWHKPRVMSWGLVFYLAKRRPDGLMRYFEELSALPRDLDFDEEVYEKCFAHAFPDLAVFGQPNRLDSEKLSRFADSWRTFVTKTHLELGPTLQEVSKARRELTR